MVNNFDSNFTRQLAKIFLKEFETARVLSKNVNTQLLKGRFNPDSGTIVDFKRPTDYVSVRTPEGDVSSLPVGSIVTGKASGIVQDYFTVFVDFQEADESLKMGQLSELLAPMATRIVTDYELDFASFMMRNSGLKAGAITNAVDTWDEVAEAGAVLASAGVPRDKPWYYTINPYTQRKLASTNRSLGSGGTSGALVSEAVKAATIADMFAGMRVMTATTLDTFTTGVGADRAGTIVGTPDPTYVTAKDTMTQSVAVTGFAANLQVRAGEVITFTGINRLNLSTRQPVIDETGSQVLFSAVVTADVLLGASGEGTLILSGPGIFEALGAYNTISSALTAGGVITLGGVASTLYQPNLFWHQDAFAIGSVPIAKLFSTDTLATTKDGLQIRVSRGVGFLENQQKVRFDFRPAFGVMNPFFAGQGFGTA